MQGKRKAAAGEAESRCKGSGKPLYSSSKLFFPRVGVPKTPGAGASDVPTVLCGTCFNMCAVANVRLKTKVRKSGVTKGSETVGITEKAAYHSVW